MLNRLCVAVVCIFPLLMTAGCSNSSSKSSQNSGSGQSAAFEFTSPATNPVIDQGQTVNLTLQGAGSGSVTWTLEAAYGTPKGTPIGTLSNKSSTGVTYTGCAPPAACRAPQQVTITATSGMNSAIITVTVNALPIIASSHSTLGNAAFVSCPPYGKLPTGGNVFTQGKNLQTNVIVAEAESGVPPYNWSIASGTLPNGVVLTPLTNYGANNGSGVPVYELLLNGTPTSTGCSTTPVELQLTDATGAVATFTNPTTLTVSTSMPLYLAVAPPALKASSPIYSNGVGGLAYAPTAFEVHGGVPPYTFCPDPSFALPTGLQTSPAISNNCSSPQASGNLVLFGTVDSSGTFAASYSVSDSQYPYPAVAGTTIYNGGSTSTVYNPSSCDPTAASPLAAFLQPGMHAFQLHGFDANGPVVIQGSFTSANNGSQGVITGGSEDVIRTTGSQMELPVTSGYYYTYGSSSNSSGASSSNCLVLNFAGGTSTIFQFSLSGCPLGGNVSPCASMTAPSDSSTTCGQNNGMYYICYPVAQIIEFDDSDGTGTRATGIMRVQDAFAFSSGLGGMYAFGLSGWDSASPAGRYSAAGSFKASSGNLTAVAADINDAGAVQSALTGGSGSSSSVDGNGRFTATMAVGSTSLNLVGYVVSSQEVMLSTVGSPSQSNPTLSGEAIATSGPFSIASLANAHIFHIGGNSGVPDVSVGVFSFDGAGDVTGTIYEDQGGTLGTTAASGSYSVDAATGRALFSAPLIGQNLGTHPLVGYVIPLPNTRTRNDCGNPASCVTGFLVGLSDSSAQSGILEFQTSSIAPPPPFSTAYLAGIYALGTDDLLDNSTPAMEGSVQVSSKFAVTEDVSYGENYCDYGSLQIQNCSQNGSLLTNSDVLNPGSLTVNANGTGSVDGESVSVTNGKVVFYINESPVNLHPSILVAEQ